jgi:RND family efflux transporter MFP subunit
MALPKLVKRGWLPLAGVGAVLLLVMQMRPEGQARRAVAPVEPLRSAVIRAEGRVVTYPGAQVTLSSEVAGAVVELRVEEKSKVRKGEVIALVDSSEQRAALAAARAGIREADAHLQRLETEFTRYQRLREAGVVTVQAFEQIQRDREAALARKAAAVAEAQRLRRAVEKSRIVAPISGVVISRMVQPGETIAGGTPLVVIADLSRTRVEAEVDEFDVGRVRLGAPVTIRAEGFTGESWQGTVEDIPDAVVDRRLKPQDPGRPVDTRVLLVKVALDGPTPLKLGQRVELEFDVRQPPRAPNLGRSAPRVVRPVPRVASP